jgi:hypothetical protein
MILTELLCDDFKSAKRNRRMIRLKQNIEGYVYIENFVKSYPKNKRLPENLLGNLPSLGKAEESYLHDYGMHEVKE